MADNLFTRLGRLFQSNVIIRKTDDNRLVVKDLDFHKQNYNLISLTDIIG